MHKGQLKSWKDDKGFGFIQSSDLTQDTFIHISSLKSMSRKPKTGDFIYFEVEKQANGKTKAINCRIEGVAAKAI
ncbi:MAG: cold shock CspA family protein, partial [Paraglaciecola sp.]